MAKKVEMLRRGEMARGGGLSHLAVAEVPVGGNPVRRPGELLHKASP